MKAHSSHFHLIEKDNSMISPSLVVIEKKEIAEFSCGTTASSWYLKPKLSAPYKLFGEGRMADVLIIDEEYEKLFGEVICVGRYAGEDISKYYASASLHVYG